MCFILNFSPRVWATCDQNSFDNAREIKTILNIKAKKALKNHPEVQKILKNIIKEEKIHPETLSVEILDSMILDPNYASEGYVLSTIRASYELNPRKQGNLTPAIAPKNKSFYFGVLSSYQTFDKNYALTFKKIFDPKFWEFRFIVHKKIHDYIPSSYWENRDIVLKQMKEDVEKRHKSIRDTLEELESENLKISFKENDILLTHSSPWTQDYFVSFAVQNGNFLRKFFAQYTFDQGKRVATLKRVLPLDETDSMFGF